VTPREYDVLRLVASGHTNGEIGEQLGLSLNTVKS
jgi:DNA-binding CsgD family transcriptional regulator